MIVLSGLGDNDSSLIARAKLAADFFFPLPFETDAFRKAFEKCLTMLNGFDEISRKRLKGSAGHTTT